MFQTNRALALELWRRLWLPATILLVSLAALSILQSKEIQAANQAASEAIVVSRPPLSYGPPRDYYSPETRPNRPVINSITGGEYGYEGNFVRIRPTGGQGNMGELLDVATLSPGQSYEVWSFVHNGGGVQLDDIRAFAQSPAIVHGVGATSVTLSMPYMDPSQVWDGAWLASAEAVAIRYVPESARIYNPDTRESWAIDQQKLFKPALADLGVPIGCDPDSTTIAAGQSCYLIYELIAVQPNFSVGAEVRLPTGEVFLPSMNVNEGDEIVARAIYRNTGTTEQNNVVVKVELPDYLSYVEGSVEMASSASDGDYVPVSDNLFTESGANVGSYSPGGNTYLKYRLLVTEVPNNCLPIEFVTRIETISGSKSREVRLIPESCDS